MSKLKVTGKIHKIMDTVQISDSFKKREFVLEIPDGVAHVSFPKFEMVQDKVSILDKFSPGDRVEVSFNLKGREYNGKFYTNLQAWFVSKPKETENIPVNNPPADGGDSLPF